MKEYLSKFQRSAEENLIEVPALYLGAEIRTNDKGEYTHQFALLPTARDPKGGLVNLKEDRALELKENTVYLIKAQSRSRKPEIHYGVVIYWLHHHKEMRKVASLREEVGQ